MVYWVKNEMGDIDYTTKLCEAKKIGYPYCCNSKYIIIECYNEKKPGNDGILKYILVLDFNMKWQKYTGKDINIVMKQLYTAKDSKESLWEASQKYQKCYNV
jgi:hypothetical protein